MATARATMDFFESQEAARRKTTLLTMYFVLAVLFIICGVYLAVLIAYNMSTEHDLGLWNPSMFGYIAAVVITIVLIGSIYKSLVLSRGDEKVAEMLGGTPVSPGTKNPHEKRLLNVVEEMAIASGVPVPRVYVLQDEKGINAFASGLSQSNAVIAVTSGCMTHLKRDELQAVVAHEFSHILNWDIRLNVRLMGIVNGILVIALIGRSILRSLTSKRSRSSSGSNKKGNGGMPLLVLGLGLLSVGYIGVLFGKLIKSAVSREREFLADASSVQFTRNPSGIVGALNKIAGSLNGSRLGSAHAEEASHMFFVNGLKRSFLRMLSTHPPIEERIRRIDPLFEGLPSGERAENEGMELREETRIKALPDELVSTVGAPQPEHVAYAAKLISDLPPDLSVSAHEPFGARALIYCLLLDRQEQVRRKQLETLCEHADPAVFAHVGELMVLVDGIGEEYRLPLIDMAFPALMNLSKAQYKRFMENITLLAEADTGMSIFECVLRFAVKRHLEPLFSGKKMGKAKYHVLDQIRMECTELLSVLAWHGSRDNIMAEEAFKKGSAELGFAGPATILAREKCENMKLLEGSLERLSEASATLKKRILKACLLSINADAMITVAEAELLRAVADSLGCPVPPLIPVPANATSRNNFKHSHFTKFSVPRD